MPLTLTLLLAQPYQNIPLPIVEDILSRSQASEKFLDTTSHLSLRIYEKDAIYSSL